MVYTGTDAGMHKHLREAAKYACFIEAGAHYASLPVSVIFGIGSRESGWGLLLKPSGPAGTGDAVPRKYTTKFRVSSIPPDGGFGRGLMQIDYDAHAFARTKDEWKDPKKNIMYGCSVLKDNREFLTRQHTVVIDPAVLLSATIASFNTGAGNVVRSLVYDEPVDHRTAHRNYSTDVLARAAWFEAVGGWGAL